MICRKIEYLKSVSGPSKDRVVEETYATTLDPDRYEALLAAWFAYVRHLPEEADDTFQAGDVNAHFQRALAILDRMGRAQARDVSASAIAEQMPGPAIVMKPEGEILSVNAACLHVLGGKTPSGLADLELDSSAMTTLRAWMKRNSLPEPKDEFLFLPSRFGSGGTQTRLLMTRVSLQAGQGDAAEDAILLAAVDVHLDAATGERLGELYSLSAAEIDVAIRLARGDTPETIAKDRLAKLATVRTQIRGVLTKLDARTVTDAVRLLTSFGATINTARAISRQAPAKSRIDRWRRQSQMTLYDGRTLSWLEQGDPAGRPVLFFHHLYLGPSWTEPAIEALARQGWRVIAPSRPGFGHSDGVSTTTLDGRIDLGIESMAQLLRNLETGPVIVVGHASGLIHAQAFAARRPELTRALLSVGGETSWEEGMESDFPWQHKIMATTLLRAPSAIGFLARATVAFIDSGREDFLLKTLHKDSPLEQRVARRPEVKQVILDGLRHTVRQGANGLVSEIRMALKDRRDIARQVRSRFRIIHGLDDNVFRPKMFELFARTVPGVELVPVPNAGQYLLYSHWPLVISELEKLWRDTAMHKKRVQNPEPGWAR